MPCIMLPSNFHNIDDHMQAYMTYTTAPINCNSLIMFLYEPKHAEVKDVT